jgi:DNA-directed DNA polymerase III PolC
LAYLHRFLASTGFSICINEVPVTLYNSSLEQHSEAGAPHLMPAKLPAGFTHLRVHSRYSLMGATASIEGLVERAKADGLRALALTDTHALYGAIVFDKACREAEIKPILGMTVCVAEPAGGSLRENCGPGHLTLLAKGPKGYRSLCRLSSLLLGDPQRDTALKKNLTWDELKMHSQGVICLDGGRSGWLYAYLKAGDQDGASRLVARIAGVYQENCVLSLEIHQPEERIIAEEVVSIASRFGIPYAAVQPVYCLDSADREALRLLSAIHQNCRTDEVQAADLPGSGNPEVDVHWLNQESLLKRFTGFPTALTQVVEIVKQCEAALPDGSPIWPSLDLPPGQSVDETLAERARAGLEQRYSPDAMSIAHKRLEGELEAITSRGFSPLFLIVSDIVRFARDADILVNTRGSVANSLVAYCMGITTVDPIAHDLLFERFLNPARTDLPDIDLDFCSRRRDEVLDYVRSTYGEERVALVATINTMRPKSAVGETAKAFGYDESRAKELTARLPRRWPPSPRGRDGRGVDDLLSSLTDEQDREVVRAASRIVGQPRHLSVHPGGVVITPGPLTGYIPVQWARKGFLITQFDHTDLEAIGLPKLDLLGIRALTVLSDTTELIRRYYDSGFRLNEIPLNDPMTGDTLSRGETIGVFQCESEGAQRTLRRLKASSVRDLAVANAFFKPGPATGGMAKAFVRRYRGEEDVSYLHPSLEPILGATKGVLIFQEQILRLAREIAGLTWEEANHLRRGMSKFRSEEMETIRARFIAGCQRPEPEGPGFSQIQAERLWEQVIPFAGYGFNQGHATAYADVSYRSAYLKTHWPAAFICARLAGHGGYHHPAIYMAEAVRLGIPVRTPHVNYSGRRITFVMETESKNELPVLYVGLDQVRDLRRRSIHSIINEREQMLYEGVRDLMVRVRLQEKEVRHLIQCGALDGLIPSRARGLKQLANVMSAGTPRQQTFAFIQPADAPAESPAQRLKWERHILGLPISVHPLELIAQEHVDVMPLRTVVDYPNEDVDVSGIRLPGWTGGAGFFLGDGETFLNVKFSEKDSQRIKPKEWAPIHVRGRWIVDEWGGGWLQADEVSDLSQFLSDDV